jgi:hypothetical protein
MRTYSRIRWGAWLLLWLVVMSAGARADDLRALLVGGGPNPENNQVAIESNVRYLLRLLPPGAARTVLFADGDLKNATVVYEEPMKPLPESERVLALLLQGREAAYPTARKFRAPTLTQLDGATKTADIAAAFHRLAEDGANASRPLLLYFTGHGSPARNRNLDNNVFDLWDGALSVRELAADLAKLPPEEPLTVVMVQCYSGAFGNLLFEGGDPKGAPVERDIAGFFATVKERPAAGCSPELNESEYRDFTSYFFAALTGRDRVGRRVTGADYNGDGLIGMNEAYCYALANDASVDVPVCTSDVFLRQIVTTPDETIFKTPYRLAREWASPAQRAALESLSRSLKLSGEERGQAAYDRFLGRDLSQPEENSPGRARRAFMRAREEAHAMLLDRWPELREPRSSGYAAARAEALANVTRWAREGKFKTLLDAERALNAAQEAEYARDLTEAHLIRFVRLFKSVVLAHTVREGSDETAKRRLARLTAAESRPLLPPAGSARTALRAPQP